jgi:hypothetical protein
MLLYIAYLFQINTYFLRLVFVVSLDLHVTGAGFLCLRLTCPVFSYQLCSFLATRDNSAWYAFAVPHRYASMGRKRRFSQASVFNLQSPICMQLNNLHVESSRVPQVEL